MQPVLFQIGSIKIYTASLFLSLGFLLSTFLIWKEGRNKGFEEEKILDLVILSVLGGIVTGRIVFVVLNPELFLTWDQMLFLWEVSGLSFYGMLLGSIITALVFIKKHHWPLELILDFLTLGFFLGLSIYSFGVFWGGGGFGAPTQFILGFNFLGLPEKRHPLSLYEFFFFAVTFWVFYYLWKKEKIKSGQVFCFGLISLGLIKAFIFLFEEKSLIKSPALTLLSRFTIIILGLLFLYVFSERGVRTDYLLFRQKMSQIKFLKKRKEDEKDSDSEEQKETRRKKRKADSDFKIT